MLVARKGFNRAVMLKRRSQTKEPHRRKVAKEEQVLTRTKETASWPLGVQSPDLWPRAPLISCRHSAGLAAQQKGAVAAQDTPPL